MDKERLKSLLISLHKELADAHEIDADTRELVRELDSDIQKLIDPAKAADHRASVLEQADSLETRFAAKHPTAERFVREIIDILGKMGI